MGLQNLSIIVKFILLINTVADEACPPERVLILTPFSHATVFLRVRIFPIFHIPRFFAKTNYT